MPPRKQKNPCMGIPGLPGKFGNSRKPGNSSGHEGPEYLVIKNGFFYAGGSAIVEEIAHAEPLFALATRHPISHLDFPRLRLRFRPRQERDTPHPARILSPWSGGPGNGPYAPNRGIV